MNSLEHFSKCPVQPDVNALNRFLGLSGLRRTLVIAILFGGSSALVSRFFLPAQTTTVIKSMSLETRVWTPVVLPPGSRPRGRSEDETNFFTPCDIHISAWVGVNPSAREGDSVTIEFYSNTNKLGSQKSNWLPELNPSAHARPGQAVPMFIRPAQFPQMEFVWKNPPPGHFTLIAKAIFGKNAPAYSRPVVIDVSPRSASQRL